MTKETYKTLRKEDKITANLESLDLYLQNQEKNLVNALTKVVINKEEEILT